MTKRITRTYEFSVESDGGKERVIVCSEDCAEKDGPEESQKYYVPTGPKTYKFKGGERAARIGDIFLDSSGEIYQRIYVDKSGPVVRIASSQLDDRQLLDDAGR